ncbi:MAG TPA: mechanosensitive ion channel domain-containing protein [Dyella sp.]|uniref:mechanosensitive ion channel family protein n=1 Tax=Dyella sp. TaxID=1869338 RepID=UPI002D78B413|nr:mechanosensitive ion channel domain-containing protein [Dyella sp.]HET6555387.1 mechanosensitive ion channel domain-containing protein [Dyella sp.]
MAALAILACLLALVSPAKALASGQDEKDEGLAQATHETATVRYFNRDIVTLRAEFLGRSPAMRASVATDNIDRIAKRGGDAQVTFKDLPQGMLVLLDGELIGLVTPADLDTLNNETMADLRLRIERNLTAAVKAEQAANSPKVLAQGAAWAGAATLIAIALLVALRWLRRHASTAMQHWLERRLLALRHEPARQFAMSIKTIGLWLVRVVIWIVALLIIEEWLRFVLALFPFTQPWSDAMRGWLVEQLEHWGAAIVGAVPGIVAAIVILLLARVLTQAISATFRSVQTGRFKLLDIDSELAEPTRKIVVAVVWLFAVAMAYPYLPGAQTEAFKGLSVLVGLMVSLGAAGIVGQAAGSFTIVYSRIMRVGDLIRSGSSEGVVLQVGLFATRIRTLTGVEISIPNTVVLGNQLHNFSRNPDGAGMWLTTGVTIGYDTPWRQVQKMLLDAADETALVEKTPAPFVLQTALSDFYVEYLLHVRITDASQRLGILSELHSRIQDRFNTSGVQIMSPHYVTDPAEAKVVSPDHWSG